MAAAISDDALATLSKAYGEGLLIGYWDDGNHGEPCVVGCCRLSPGSTVNSAKWDSELSAIAPLLSVGMSVLGLFTADGLADTLAEPLKGMAKSIKAASGGGRTLAAIALAEGHVRLHLLKDGESKLTDREVTSGVQDPFKDFVVLRLSAKVTIFPGDCDAACAKLRNTNAGYLVRAPGGGQHFVDLATQGDAAVSSLVPAHTDPAETSGGGGGGKKGKKGGGGGKSERQTSGGDALSGGAQTVEAAMLWSHGCGGAAIESPVLVREANNSSRGGFDYEACVVGYLPAACDLSTAGKLMGEGACRQAKLACEVLKKGGGTPTGMLFALPQLSGACIMPVYAVPDEVDAMESSMLNERKGLHNRFMLPMDRPYVRLAQAQVSQILDGGNASGGDGGRGGRLRNVHEGLGGGGVKGGTLHLVGGTYDYCHYMQDKFNDDGWGCMYRSLQTVVSWFRHQHYTSKPIPPHPVIQKILAAGSAKKDIIGSKQWIGSMEAVEVLDAYLGVSCKMIIVSTGDQLEDKGRELAQHFDTQGTPICVGGGVLAFTMLGVDYNAETGGIRFLILDPHYTGSEDLSTIQDPKKKNACSGIASVGWHDVSIFRKDSFYNLACPQRPQEI